MMMPSIEKVRVESDERGFELHLLDFDGEWHIFNVHSCAEQLYDAVKAGIGPWLQERDAARAEFKSGKGAHAYCPAEDGACYRGLDHECPGVEAEQWIGESALDYYRRTGNAEPLAALADAVRDGRDDRP